MQRQKAWPHRGAARSPARKARAELRRSTPTLPRLATRRVPHGSLTAASRQPHGSLTAAFCKVQPAEGPLCATLM